ncbi:multiple monosaccharide ABC transporter substrate-binding protein [Schaalia hyovaginalis]|uniref:multiple monosaccharide ABC transporter substrate-binding protein n=1 Tax=Schaalia hyovaginalis TaxID=29316 RepID=UPI0026F0F58A|nr:multiple monosaccharide ABC transporter substrate-binding protein [Schaalia hyovaginalis]MDD7553970.1 sugar ABC transporter substrate-binding protein [Schaalia hyovaginalis]MDY3093475.1 multiple monosaccharide ABC transporter substrate-binding protein [Schaalia hyovaginalis]
MTIRRIFGRRAAGLAAVLSAGALALSACAGGGAGSTTDAAASGAAGSAEGIKVGVAMPTQTSERWIADGNAVKEGLEKAGYVVDLQYANDDIPTQTQQIDQMITNGAKILVIASIDGTALSSQLDAAGAANIPVVSYDRLIRDNENVDFYVSFDNYKVGVAQAKALLFGLGLTDKDGNKAADAPKGPLNIELFAGSPDDNNAGFFFNGAMDTLKPFVEDGTLVVKSGQTAFDQVATLRWSQEAAQKRMEDILTSTYGGGSEPLAGVLSPFDGISRGIITALQGAGYGPTIEDGLPVVTGQDAEIASIKLINDGVQQSTIFKDTRLLAEQAVKTVKAIGSGSEPEANDTETYDNGMKVVPSFLLEVQTIFKDNIESDIIGSGYYTADEVEAGVSK